MEPHLCVEHQHPYYSSTVLLTPLLPVYENIVPKNNALGC